MISNTSILLFLNMFKINKIEQFFHCFRLCCMSCILSDTEVPRSTCYIDHICVDNSFRGKGIGKALLERADHEAMKNGCQVSII